MVSKEKKRKKKRKAHFHRKSTPNWLAAKQNKKISHKVSRLAGSFETDDQQEKDRTKEIDLTFIHAKASCHDFICGCCCLQMCYPCLKHDFFYYSIQFFFFLCLNVADSNVWCEPASVLFLELWHILLWKPIYVMCSLMDVHVCECVHVSVCEAD